MASGTQILAFKVHHKFAGLPGIVARVLVAQAVGKRMVVQGVGGRLQHYYDRDWRAGEPRGTRLVIIAQQGLDRAAVEASLAGRS